MKAGDAGRKAMRAEGVQLAQARRAEFKALIANDPQRALEQAVPRVVRQELPPEIVSELEKPVSATGGFRVYRGRPADGAAVHRPEATKPIAAKLHARRRPMGVQLQPRSSPHRRHAYAASFRQPRRWIPLARSQNGGAFTSPAPEAAVSETGTSPVSVTITITPTPPQQFFNFKAETTSP